MAGPNIEALQNFAPNKASQGFRQVHKLHTTQAAPVPPPLPTLTLTYELHESQSSTQEPMPVKI